MDNMFGEFIPLYSGYVPPKRKWYQKIFDFFYNIRNVIFTMFMVAIWIGYMILFVKMGYGEMVLYCIPCGLISGILLGIVSGRQ